MLFRSGFGPEGSLITFESPLVHRIEMSDLLIRWVAMDGRSHALGGIYLVPSGQGNTCELWMSHSMVGDRVDRSTLISTLIQLLVLCDELDDRIRQRFGGVRFHDRQNRPG